MKMKVKVIERDEVRCRQLSEEYPELTIICGDGTDQELLESESMTDYDCFIALTNSDEDNFIISQYAQQKQLPKVITKCSRKNYTGIARAVGLDSVISPKFITAASILHVVRGLQNSQGSVMNSLHRIVNGTAEVIEFTVSPNTRNLDIPLKDLRLKSNVLLAVIVRGDHIIIPQGNSCMTEGDRVILIAPSGKILDLDDIFAG